jgi:hypothetical protein
MRGGTKWQADLWYDDFFLFAELPTATANYEKSIKYAKFPNPNSSSIKTKKSPDCSGLGD